MKFKKNWKRFWTLDRHHAEGFTLVELIVVIAILAILGGVAVPAYSGYVKKANMAADQTLAAEVANALLLQYYSDPDAATGGYVVLSTSGAEGDGDDGVGTKAMNAAFGEGWTETAALKYDGWTDDGMLSYVVSNADSATTVANSNYFTNSTPDKLVCAFSSLTDALSGMAATAAKDPMETLDNIGAMSDEQLTEMREDLNNLGLSWSTEAGADNSAYSTALSNLMVKYVSDELANVDTNDENPEISTLATAAVRYAMVYGWASSSEAGSNTLATLNSTITSGNADASTILDTIFNVDASEGSDFYNYLSNDSSLTDQTAFLTIMGAVSDFSQDFDMTTAGLYSSGSISDMVNNYASAVTAVAGMTSEQIASLSSTSSGTVVIFISENGSVAVTPASAYAGN